MKDKWAVFTQCLKATWEISSQTSGGKRHVYLLVHNLYYLRPGAITEQVPVSIGQGPGLTTQTEGPQGEEQELHL